MCWIDDKTTTGGEPNYFHQVVRPSSQTITTDEVKIALLEKLVKEGKVGLSDGLKLLQVEPFYTYGTTTTTGL